MFTDMSLHKKTENIFVSLLDALQVKHTRSYSRKIFREHPHNHNLLGLSQMLSEYGIKNQGLRVKDKEEALTSLDVPFVAHIGNDFVTVEEIVSGQIGYSWKDKKIWVSSGEFLNMWSGIALVVETAETSIEPQYKEHRKHDVIEVIKQGVLLCAILAILGIAGLQTGAIFHIHYLLAAGINLTGVYIGYLLIQKQLKVEGGYADKICSLLLHQSDCNNVLESAAAKFLGILSWSEIGLGYFMGNILLIFCFPSLYPYIALVNIVALPYTVWSIWYQKRVAKQWCPLCLMALSVLWLFFLFNLMMGMIRWPVWNIHSLLITGVFFAIPVLSLNLLLRQLSQSQKTEQIQQELNSLKADESIFLSLLKTKPYYQTDRSFGILWGNPEAKNLITIITNSHCNPCARMHQRLEALMEELPESYCFQYILTSFNADLEKSSKLFIAMYQQLSPSGYLRFLTDWYERGKNNREAFYDIYKSDEDDEAMLSEFQKQKEWIFDANIQATPTILFNGYELPSKYKPEDLKYFAYI